MNSIQQFSYSCVDFFNKMLGGMVTKHMPMAELSQHLETFLQQLGQSMLESLLEQADEAIHAAVKPTHIYQSKGYRPRALTTIWGDVSFSHRYYRNKQDGTYQTLLDEWIGLEKYTHIEPLCQAKLVANAAHTSYRKAIAMTTSGSLSAQSVVAAIRKVGTIPNAAAAMPTPKEQVGEIYIEADEDHVSVVNEKNKQMKLVIVYELKETVCKGRRKLCGKRVFTGFDSPSVLWNEVADYISATYGQEQAPPVMIKGDGANWIKSGMKYIPNNYLVVDGYHAGQYLLKIAGNGTRKALYDALRENDCAQFAKEVERKQKVMPARKKQIEEGYRYIMSNWDGIHEALTNPNVASSTEGHVSHILSDRLSSRGMA